MSANYYYLDGEQHVHGPFTKEDMWELRETNRLHVGTNVCLEGTEDWKLIGDFPELRPPSLSVARAPAPPAPAFSASAHVPARLRPTKAPITASQVGCLGCGGLLFVCFFGSLLSKCTPAPSTSSSSVSTNYPSNAAREAETMDGFKEGRRIGNRRFREGFPRPSVAYLDSILAAVDSDRSEAYKIGFKGGYLSAWENGGRDL